ncbi:MAG: hypothetical protein WCX84_09205 [Syntrophales bacterium]|jgi:hypothetical protein|nr:hypothetical protein [Syntrophales bacterium]
MDGELIEKIALPNGIVLEIRDCSRPIAADTDRVSLRVLAPIPIDPSFFTGDDGGCERMRHHYGDSLLFEHGNERSFVPKGERERVFRGFVAAFKEDTLPYLSRPDFARRFVRSKYRDLEKKTYPFPGTGQETEG